MPKLNILEVDEDGGFDLDNVEVVEESLRLRKLLLRPESSALCSCSFVASCHVCRSKRVIDESSIVPANSCRSSSAALAGITTTTAGSGLSRSAGITSRSAALAPKTGTVSHLRCWCSARASPASRRRSSR